MKKQIKINLEDVLNGKASFKECKISLDNPYNRGRLKIIPFHEDHEAEAFLKYIIACCKFLKKQKLSRFESFVENLDVMKAHLPWPKKWVSPTGYKFWVCASSRENGFVIIHDALLKHEKIATLVHELMHYLYYKRKTDKCIHKKAIEVIKKIIKNYSAIKADKEIFKKYNIKPNLLSLRDLKAVLRYLEETLFLFSKKMRKADFWF